MTPATTLVRIEELERRDLTQAWMIANLQRAKHFPRSPMDLWAKAGASRAPEQSDAMILAMAQGRAAAKEKEKTRKKPR